MRVRFSKVAFLAIAACSAVAVRGAVVLKNADWATASFVTNGMEAAHGHFPSGVTSFTVEAWVKPTANVTTAPNGFMVAGWDYVDPLELADPPRGILLLFR